MSEASESKGKGAQRDWGIHKVPIKWDEDQYRKLISVCQIPESWGPEFSAEGKTAMDAPTGKMTLYESHFLNGFRFPTTKFIVKMLQQYGFHVTQCGPLGMVRLVHFELTCQAIGIEPTFEKFDAFYQAKIEAGGDGWYAFKPRSKRPPVSTKNPKSMHSWKEKFLYINRGVIAEELPWMAMSYWQRLEKRAYPFKGNVPRPVWYDQLVAHASPLDNIHKCSNRLFVYFGCSQVGIKEGQEVVRVNEGNIPFCFVISVFGVRYVMIACYVTDETDWEVFEARGEA